VFIVVDGTVPSGMAFPSSTFDGVVAEDAPKIGLNLRWEDVEAVCRSLREIRSSLVLLTIHTAVYVRIVLDGCLLRLIVWLGLNEAAHPRRVGYCLELVERSVHVGLGVEAIVVSLISCESKS